jgi:hypothetical protein
VSRIEGGKKCFGHLLLSLHVRTRLVGPFSRLEGLSRMMFATVDSELLSGFSMGSRNHEDIKGLICCFFFLA